jgi:hypothetical protein
VTEDKMELNSNMSRGGGTLTELLCNNIWQQQS